MSSSNDEPRQRVVRVPGARRARLTPAPGVIGEPDAHDDPDAAATASAALPAGAGSGERRGAGPNDERLRRDVPPHY